MINFFNFVLFEKKRLLHIIPRITSDGSTDSSLQIMQDYAKKDSRIHFSTRENRGLILTLNELLYTARGAWIARMDADDISLPNRLAYQLAWLEKNRRRYMRQLGAPLWQHRSPGRSIASIR